MSDAVGEAIRIIGPSDLDDWEIRPVGHAGRYRLSAPALAKLLESSAVRIVAERYQELDAQAVERQQHFARTADRARAAVFQTGVFAALLLAAGALSALLPDVVRTVVIAIATAGAVVTGALASMWLRRIREGRLLERWLTARAQAEQERLRYFEAITVKATAPDPILRLEYFRRYQLDVQRAYFAGRGRDHRVAADRALGRSTTAVAAGAIASGLAGVLGVLDPAWTALAAVALAAQAWAARMTNDEATAQNRRNAERYDRTRVALDRIGEKLDEVRAAVAAGDTAVLREFVRVVHEQLAIEHRQWLEAMEAAGAAITKLEELLSKYRENPPSRDDPQTDPART